MPALIPTEHHATVTWLGYVPHRKEAAIETRALDQMPLGWEGFVAYLGHYPLVIFVKILLGPVFPGSGGNNKNTVLDPALFCF